MLLLRKTTGYLGVRWTLRAEDVSGVYLYTYLTSLLDGSIIMVGAQYASDFVIH